MNIVFVSAVLPYPLLSGGQVRIFNLLSQLSKRHRITLFSFIRSETERQYAKKLGFLDGVELFYRGKRLQARYLMRTLTGMPLLLSSYRHDGMKQRLEEFLRGHTVDVVHIEPFYVVPSLPDKLPRLVVGEHNVEYQVYRDFAAGFPVPFVRPFLRMEATGIGVWETKTLRRADRASAVSEADASVLAGLAPDTPVTVVPNGVDTSWFRYSEKRFGPKPLRAVFVGNFNWVPNIGAAERLVKTVWPEVSRAFPDAQLTVVGRNLPVSLRSSAGHVRFRDNVADIRDAFDHADVLMAPMQIAGGSKFKILEAMASGVPVITTQAGAAGLPLRDGVHVMLAETPQQTVAALRSLSEDARKRTDQIRKARELTVTSFDWKHIAEKLSRVWEEAI